MISRSILLPNLVTKKEAIKKVRKPKRTSGIYRITCVVPGIFRNKKYFYYGQSVSVFARKNQHFRDLLEGCHENIYLQNFYFEALQSGKDISRVMRWKIVKKCPKWQLEAWERYFIQHKRSDFNIKRPRMTLIHYCIVFWWQITIGLLGFGLYLFWRFFL